jgi:hypothetical protein
MNDGSSEGYVCILISDILRSITANSFLLLCYGRVLKQRNTEYIILSSIQIHFAAYSKLSLNFLMRQTEIRRKLLAKSSGKVNH